MGTNPSKNLSFTRIPRYDLNNLAVITVIFNPLKYRSRYEWYHKFDEHMSRSKVTLLTVECIFDSADDLGLPKQTFDVTAKKDPRHFQIRAPSVLWLKENLINVVVKHLPADIEYVAWLDADIEFARLDWPHLTIYQLQTYEIVQLFEQCSFLGPKGKKQVLRQDHSFAYAIRHDKYLDARRSAECHVHPGYGWAMRRAVFDRMHGLAEFAILGSGDLHFAYALINRIDETIPRAVHENYRAVARMWGAQVAHLADNGTRVGYVPVHIWHYWHGDRVNRGYLKRCSILEEHQFAPRQDLEKNDQTGLLRLKTHSTSGQVEHAKRLKSLEMAIVSYFRSRNEDNVKKFTPEINSSKLRSSASDVIRPASTLRADSRESWTTDIRRASSALTDFAPVHRARPSTWNNLPDAHYQQPASEIDLQGRAHSYHAHTQYTEHDDGDPAAQLALATEISF